MIRDDDMKGATLAGLERLLDVLGSDRSRWPARERLRYSALIAESAEARRMLAEAEALDALLDKAAPETVPRSVDALAARIMAAAGTASHAGGQNVTPLQRRTTNPRSSTRDRALGWPAAALLAASLVLGVFAGGADVMDDQMQALTGLTTTQSYAEDDATPLAWGGDEVGAAQEDLL